MPATEKIALAIASVPSRSREQTEMCEHKGIGHPDSLCDGAVEAAARALCRAYLEAYGAVQHFNLDKALLIGGVSAPKFGGGKVLRPMRLLVSGPVTELPSANAEQVVEQAIREYLATCLGGVGNDIRIEPILRPSAPNLRRVTESASLPLSNDTSFGVGYAPHSSLERAVLLAAHLLRSLANSRKFEAAGLDYKVMGSRLDEHQRLTIALAFVDRCVRGVPEYFTHKEEIGSHLAAHIGIESEIVINTLDNRDAVDESGIYLTVTGLSAEHGDDGQVGRGNRVNGLITPYRPMSLEAAAGKNPASHVGKLYNVLAHRLAAQIHASIDGADEVVVRLLSGIGRPIDQPQLVAVDIVAEHTLSPAQEHQIRELATQRLAELPALVDELVHGTVTVF
ncbi:S-adenosylmethionine synthetase [Cupriavidus sp. TA19]|uniref:methionine adenosyltransferase n=1 Tax=unclassified Cupriavidus TaxID=2640874 RepID=UPI000E2F0DB3|nr:MULTISPECIES: methionine adenosyltransferase [unclassified Cupriavidus]BDB29311.1 methionine adenosyltransferase [Cupriavidus sp. P-10]GLC95816.1 S-adenosylmethionine synthetase [Cupriavidus sp. TA19]